MNIIIGLTFLVSIVLYFSSFKWLSKNGIFLILPINVLADTFIIFTSGSELHSGLLRVPLLLAVILACLPKLKSTKLSVMMFIYIIFTFALCFLSSNIDRSIVIYFKFALSLIIFPIALVSFKTGEDVKKFWYSNMFTVVLVLANFFAAQIFDFGDRAYSEESAYLPGGGVYLSYVLTYIMLAFPLMQLYPASRRMKTWTPILLIMGALVILLIFRRATILAVILGFASMITSSTASLRKKIGKYALYAIFGVILILPIYGKAIMNLYQQRFVNGVTKEMEASRGRKAEAEVVFSELFTKSVKHTLIGSEFLNSREVFSDWSSGGRNIHNDFMSLLYGTGLLGLCYYLWMIYVIIKEFGRQVSPFKNTSRGKTIKSVFRATLIAFVLLSISSQLYVVTAYSFLWIMLAFYVCLPKIMLAEDPALQPKKSKEVV